MVAGPLKEQYLFERGLSCYFYYQHYVNITILQPIQNYRKNYYQRWHSSYVSSKNGMYFTFHTSPTTNEANLFHLCFYPVLKEDNRSIQHSNKKFACFSYKHQVVSSAFYDIFSWSFYFESTKQEHTPLPEAIIGTFIEATGAVHQRTVLSEPILAHNCMKDKQLLLLMLNF